MIGSLRDIKLLLNSSNIQVKDKDIAIDFISTDTRNIDKNSIFLAIKGDNLDGHDFINIALEKGAKGIIIDKNSKAKRRYSLASVIEVEDTIEAYGKIAGYYRDKMQYKVVAITGSSGKTTTKDLVAKVLETKYKVIKTFKNNNNEIGLPYTILGASEETEVLVLEMGMRALGEIEYLTKIADPDIGIITNIGTAHIGELGSRKNIYKGKTELYKNIKASGIALINGEDEFFSQTYSEAAIEKRVFGFKDNASIRAKILEEKDGATKLEIYRNKKVFKVEIPLLGEHLILDALAAIETGFIFGLEFDKIVEGLYDQEISPGRMEIKEFKGFRVIDDTYNANPDSMKASLNILNKYKGFKIAVLGDMKELGQDKRLLHRQIGEYCYNLNLDALITVGDLGKYIAEGLEASACKTKIIIARDRENAGEELKRILKEGSVVLIKGSRAMKMEEIIKLLEVEK